MTILEALQRSADFLQKKGVESPRLQVELLLAHVLKMPRMKLYLNFEKPLDSLETDALRALVLRRGQREPLQYIVGTVSFCGFELIVNRSVLIPRPETELLAERAWNFLNALAADSSPHALDLCTGSGCLALAIAAKSPTAKIFAADISEEALSVARQNIERNGAGDRITLRCGDLFAALESQIQFNLIVSNPPYIASAEVDSLAPELRDFEPRIALDGGKDGLDIIRKIAAQAGAFLKKDGRIMLELEEEGADATKKVFAESGWIVEAIAADYNDKPRILIARAAV